MTHETVLLSLSETDAYASTVAWMALDRKHKSILDLVNNIKGTVSDTQLDQILFHAVSAYVVERKKPEDEEWTYWFAEGLVELMASPHAKVRAFVTLGNIEAGYKCFSQTFDLFVTLLHQAG